MRIEANLRRFENSRIREFKMMNLLRSRFFLLSLFCLYLLEAYSQELTGVILQNKFRSDLVTYKQFEVKHRRYVDTKNVKLSYLQWGDTSATERVFVWLHGSLSNAYEFMPFAQDMTNQGYRVLSIDQYNAGKTEAPFFDASFDDLCSDIKSLFDHLEIKRVVIGGFSRGGFLATNFYKLYPDYVDALILEDGGSVDFDHSYLHLDSLGLKEKLQQVNVPEDIKEKYFGYHRSKFEAYKSLYNPEETSNQFQILSYIKPQGSSWVTYRGQPEYYHMQDSLHMSEVLFSSPKVSKYAASIINLRPAEIFQNLSVPVLIMDARSSKDPIPIYEANRALVAQHPNLINHQVFENIEHNIHYANPNGFIKAIISFLQSQPR